MSAARAVAATRWRIAVTLRSLRVVPPALALLAFLGIFLTQRNQTWASIVAVDVVAAYVLALWMAVAHAGALADGHRDITQVTTGRRVALAAELAGSVALAIIGVIVMLAWALALQLASPGPSVVAVGSALLAGLAAVVAGVATGQLVDMLPIGPPGRFVAAVGLLTLTVARPSITPVVSWIVPPVMELAKAVNEQRSSDTWWAGVGLLAWSAVTVVIVDLTSRFNRRATRG